MADVSIDCLTGVSIELSFKGFFVYAIQRTARHKQWRIASNGVDGGGGFMSEIILQLHSLRGLFFSMELLAVDCSIPHDTCVCVIFSTWA